MKIITVRNQSRFGGPWRGRTSKDNEERSLNERVKKSGNCY